MKNTIKVNLVKSTDSGLVTSVSGAVFVLAFWDSKPCFLTSILPKFYPLVRLLKVVTLNTWPVAFCTRQVVLKVSMFAIGGGVREAMKKNVKDMTQQ